MSDDAIFPYFWPVGGTLFGQEGEENTKLKFCFSRKLPIISIKQKCPMGVGSFIWIHDFMA